jgi:hypothetical protein
MRYVYVILSKPMHAFRQFQLPDPLPMRISQQQLGRRAVMFALGAVEPATWYLACENFILNKERNEATHDVNHSTQIDESGARKKVLKCRTDHKTTTSEVNLRANIVAPSPPDWHGVGNCFLHGAVGRRVLSREVSMGQRHRHKIILGRSFPFDI